LRHRDNDFLIKRVSNIPSLDLLLDRLLLPELTRGNRVEILLLDEYLALALSDLVREHVLARLLLLDVGHLGLLACKLV